MGRSVCDNRRMDASIAARSGAAAIALAMLLAACGWAEWPPPGSAPRAASRPPAPVSISRASAPVFVGADAVIVGKGDSVHALARRHRVSARAIIEANRLTPPYHLRVGQRIKLPRRRTHTVRRGDTLYGISRLYGTDSFVLARANGLSPPYTIYVGKRLDVPSAVRPARAAARPAAGKAPRPQSTPGAAAAAASGPRPVVPRKPKAPIAVPRPPAASGKGFIWPLEGRLISTFGAKSKGLHNDGINIAAAHGSPVRAAENGVVAYAGNELRGFGNLLLIKHAGGWITAYAHNAELLVERGRRVRKGETIAKVGNSGNVSEPQLHFELRRGRRAVDPRKYLKGGRA